MTLFSGKRTLAAIPSCSQTVVFVVEVIAEVRTRCALASLCGVAEGVDDAKIACGCCSPIRVCARGAVSTRAWSLERFDGAHGTCSTPTTVWASVATLALAI